MELRLARPLAMQPCALAALKHSGGKSLFARHMVGEVDQHDVLERGNLVQGRLHFWPQVRAGIRCQRDKDAGARCIEQFADRVAFEQWIDRADNTDGLGSPDHKMRFGKIRQYIGDDRVSLYTQSRQHVRGPRDIAHQFAERPAFRVRVSVRRCEER